MDTVEHGGQAVLVEAAPGGLARRLHELVVAQRESADARVREVGEDGPLASTIRLEGYVRGLEDALVALAAEVDRLGAPTPVAEVAVTTRPAPAAPISLDPAVVPAPLWALAAEEMPSEAHFRRDHFPVPAFDAGSWRLIVDGAVERPLELTLGELLRLPRRELRVVLECAGHRRAEFEPPAAGLQWGVGALGEAVWQGAALGAVLALAGLRPEAAFVVLAGADRGQFRDQPEQVSFARALPLDKALDPDTLLAWTMNGEPLPEAHGAPLRAVVPGWYATDSIKWVTHISVLEQPYSGPFEAIDYRLADDALPEGRRMTDLPVHAILTSPAPAAEPIAAGLVELSGIAWGGTGIAAVDISIDDEDWQPARLDRPRGRYARTFWHASWEASPGEHVVAVRAAGSDGTIQRELAEWNERGYGNASIQRVRLVVA